MKILLTGSTGYIAKRLLPVLLEKGHKVFCCVRDVKRFDAAAYHSDLLEVIECDFLYPDTLNRIPDDIDAGYYLIHSMATTQKDFESLEKKSAQHFRDRMEQTKVKHIVYLSGIINTDVLSRHLQSRKTVEEILSAGRYHLTTLRAGIIIGEGSASFEIMRDLIEKLPLMITPKWLKTKSQPIAIGNVIQFLQGVVMNKQTFDKSYDIGGTEILTYKEMLLRFARVRNLKRRIFIVPVMTPKLSSYWLYFITSTSYKLAVNLVDSMKVEVICKPNDLQKMLNVQLLTYDEAVRLSFTKTEQLDILSSWTDASSTHALDQGISSLVKLPTYGCFTDIRKHEVMDKKAATERIWSIGGDKGWYYANWLWELRGFIDKLFGGVGLRKGRKSLERIMPGDSIGFWRVLFADKKEKRLLLYAEMKLPGEAWLEFKMIDHVLYQTATFRPLGLSGRLYWYALLPVHKLIFNGMAKRIAG